MLRTKANETGTARLKKGGICERTDQSEDRIGKNIDRCLEGGGGTQGNAGGKSWPRIALLRFPIAAGRPVPAVQIYFVFTRFVYNLLFIC